MNRTILTGGLIILAGAAAGFFVPKLVRNGSPTVEEQIEPELRDGASGEDALPKPTGRIPVTESAQADATGRDPVQPPPPPGQEFDHLLEHRQVVSKHNAWQAEDQDPVWARSIEDRWRDRLAAKPELSSFSVECRTTMCEIRFVARGLDEPALTSVINRSEVQQPAQTEQQAQKVDSKLIQRVYKFEEQQGQTVGVMFLTFARTKQVSPPAQ